MTKFDKGIDDFGKSSQLAFGMRPLIVKLELMRNWYEDKKIFFEIVLI